MSLADAPRARTMHSNANLSSSMGVHAASLSSKRLRQLAGWGFPPASGPILLEPNRFKQGPSMRAWGTPRMRGMGFGEDAFREEEAEAKRQMFQQGMR